MAEGDRRSEWAGRAGNIAIGLLILGAAWYLLRIPELLAGAIAGVVVASGLLPPRLGAVAGALGWFAIAALGHFYYGMRQVPILLVIVGVVFLIPALMQLRARSA